MIRRPVLAPGGSIVLALFEADSILGAAGCHGHDSFKYRRKIKANSFPPDGNFKTERRALADAQAGIVSLECGPS
jgi:hypothetical protein